MKENILWGIAENNYFKFVKDLFSKFNIACIQVKSKNFSVSNIVVFESIFIYRKLVVQSLVNMPHDFRRVCSITIGNYVENELLYISKI